MNENYIKNLERELKLSKLELNMLNRTYEESLEKGSYMDVRTLRNECVEKSKHIFDLEQEISSYYADLKQRNGRHTDLKLQESKKYKDEASECLTVTDYSPYNSNSVTCTHPELKNDVKTEFDRVLDELQTNLGKCTRNNRFLVHMLNIPSDMICSAEVYGEDMLLRMYNFINDVNEPIYSKLGNIKENDRQFDVMIEFLDSRGEVMYKEIYKDCRIKEISRSTLDYSSDDFMKNNIYLTYNDVVFEKPGIQKRKRSNNLNENCLKEENKCQGLQ